jgi:hypothetical protein
LAAEITRRRLTVEDLNDVSTAAVAERSDRMRWNRVWGKLKGAAFVGSHWIIGAYGSTVVVGMSIYGIRLLVEQFIPQWVYFTYSVLMPPFFPLQTLTALLCGYFLAREPGAFSSSKVAQLAWILPTYFLVSNILVYESSALMESRWEHFFWSSAFHSRMQQRDVTLPFLSSICYSIGHFVGTTRRQISA